MIELSVGREGKARIWLQETPNCLYSASQVLVCQLPARNAQGVEGLYVAAEVFLHRGGYCPYGLLGAYFVPACSESLTIQVSKSFEDEQIMENSLAGYIDQVRFGLPSEYVESVLHGAISASTLSRLSSGTLSFNCAAHGEIGSSKNIFYRLSEAVVFLTAVHKNSNKILNKEEILSILGHCFL